MTILQRMPFILILLASLAIGGQAMANQCQQGIQRAQKECKKLQQETKGMAGMDGVKESGSALQAQCKKNEDKVKPLVNRCKQAISQCQRACQRAKQQKQAIGATGAIFCGKTANDRQAQYRTQYLNPGEKTLSNMRSCQKTGSQLAKDSGKGGDKGQGGEKKQEGQQQQAKKQQQGQPMKPPQMPQQQPKQAKQAKPDPCADKKFANANRQQCKGYSSAGANVNRYNQYVDPTRATALFDDPEVGEWDPTLGGPDYTGAQQAVAGYMQYESAGAGVQYGSRSGARGPASVKAAAKLGAISESADKLGVAGQSGSIWQEVKDGEAKGFIGSDGKAKPLPKKQFGEKVFVNGQWKDPNEMSRNLNDSQVEFLRSQDLINNLGIRLNAQIDRGDICDMHQKIKELKGSEDPKESDLGFDLEVKIYRKLKSEGFTGDETGLSMRCNMFI